MLVLQEINIIKYNINMLDIEDFKKKLDKKSVLKCESAQKPKLLFGTVIEKKRVVPRVFLLDACC